MEMRTAIAADPRRGPCREWGRAWGRAPGHGSPRRSCGARRPVRRCLASGAMLPDTSMRPPGRLMRAPTIEPLPDIARGGLQAAVLAYRAELLRFLAARGAAADEAEDVLQDLYVK